MLSRNKLECVFFAGILAESNTYEQGLEIIMAIGSIQQIF
jgi:hypothetical protein